ncbi:dTDP-4-dehydrorhamnose 3,5-epimerase [Endozoicomonas elysicola]|uniref:dTDP-4-dehydrorhamnose 3,5-epimerase n=1 Tax=Endozoicomonas elysicola TaxID=305900 RepID=A0A081K9D6_9GAMM|nr:dTDP-4-dehydrorhamnose 3,5-epimerase [Endozoicomonas elysicola]KEI70762.1 dTDP-4-dehydrorhamnose 3,5-epimerase [Endozoicomonas elysicola]
MNIIETPIQDLLIIEPKVFGDERGYFMETFQARTFAEFELPSNFVQDNHSYSARGILRGLHFQKQHPQGKLVRVIDGEVYDVAVDLRKDSATYGQSYGLLLSGDNKRMFWVPAGFAHGFYVVSETAHFLYKCTDYYAPDYEMSIAWDDPELGIDWPLVNGEPPQLSAKDQLGVCLADAGGFNNGVYEP